LAKIRIIDTTKQYIAIDSIIARPTNKVRVRVDAVSGCWAIELNADITARASPKAGLILPIAIVSPAVMMEAAPINVILSMVLFLLFLRLLIYSILSPLLLLKKEGKRGSYF
jgi:hypothetical protein